jgi:hypothetical protein
MYYKVEPIRAAKLSDFLGSSNDTESIGYYKAIHDEVVDCIRKLLRYGETLIPTGLMPYFSDVIREDLPNVYWREVASYENCLVVKLR